MRIFLVALFALGVSVYPSSASAQKSRHLRPNRINIEYTKPKNPDHETVLRILKEHKVLEKFKEFLSPLRLPRPMLLKTEGCDGDSNAWYENDTVTVCYEYIDELFRNAPQQDTPAGVTRAYAIIGPSVEVFLHEVGHATFDYLNIPVMGREEDAADQFASYFLLQFSKSDARKLIAGVAYTYHREASIPSTKKNPFADEHGLPAQRFYNVICLAYGSDPKFFADLVDKSYLPKERSEACVDEYKQVAKAMKILVRPYIDERRARQVRAKEWLTFDVPN